MMKKTAIVLLSLLFANAAIAQDDPTTRSTDRAAPPSTEAGHASPASEPASRGQVKSETRAAVRANAIPRGQEATPNEAGGTPPAAVSRADIDRDARKAEKDRQPPYGLTSQWNQMNAGPSTANRAVVKQDAKIAEHAGAIPRGEASSMPTAAPHAD